MCEVYPGDSVTVGFYLVSGTTWKTTWSVAPGATGKAAGAKATSGSQTYTFSKYSLPLLLFLLSFFNSNPHHTIILN